MVRLFGIEIVPAAESSNSPNSVLDHPSDEDDQMKLGKFRDEVDASTFLGLKFKPSSSCMHNNPPPPPPPTTSSSPGKKKRTESESDQGKKKQMREEDYAQVPTVELSSEFRGLIGNPPVVFVYRKRLTATDVQDSQNRLLVTRKEKLVDEYLTDEEREAFVGRDEKIAGIGIDRTGSEYSLRLGKWGNEKKTTVFNDEWGDIIAQNGAEVGHWVDLWGFRRQGEPKMCFAINFST